MTLVENSAIGSENTTGARSDLATEDGLVDARIDELAISLPAQGLLAQKAEAFGCWMGSSGLRSSLCTVWGIAVAVACIALLFRSKVLVETPQGGARASCGLDVYVYGYPDHVVDQACRHAEAGRLEFFIPAIVLVIAGVLGVLVAGWSASQAAKRVGTVRLMARRSPVRSTLVVLGAVAGIVGLFALRPVPQELSISGRLVSVSCGANSYFLGYPSSIVHAVCQHAYSGQAHVLVDSAAVLVVGLLALCSLLVSLAQQPARRRRLIWIFASLLFAAIALFACLPVPVDLGGTSGVLSVNCGLDTYLAGYPEQAVQAACRSHLTGHAVTAAIALFLMLFALGGAIRASWSSPPKRADESSVEDIGPVQVGVN